MAQPTRSAAPDWSPLDAVAAASLATQPFSKACPAGAPVLVADGSGTLAAGSIATASGGAVAGAGIGTGADKELLPDSIRAVATSVMGVSSIPGMYGSIVAAANPAPPTTSAADSPSANGRIWP